MKTLISALVAIAILATCCSSGNFKIRPEYKGVAPEAQPLLDEYLWLSKQNHIQFYNKVTVGFKTLDSPTVGLCTWGGYFREIDIDTTYWKVTGKTTKMAVFFHELTHCYCGRGHDYGDGINYPKTTQARWDRAMEWLRHGGPRPGYLEDGCPTSIMYPVVVDDTCMKSHYQEYTTEMFNRCKPW